MEENKAIKTFQYRIYPTKVQELQLQGHLDVTRAWYNMCLEERLLVYQSRKVKETLANGGTISEAATFLKIRLPKETVAEIKKHPKDERKPLYDKAYEEAGKSPEVATLVQIFANCDLPEKVSKFDQYKQIAAYRKSIPAARCVSVAMLRRAAMDLDESYQAFFKKKKAEKKAGLPGYRQHQFHSSFGVTQWEGGGIRLVNHRLYIFGIDGTIKIKWHRPYEGTIKTSSVIRKADGWYISLTCEIEKSEPLPPTDRAIGVDCGIHHLMTTSDGKIIDNPKWYQESQRRLRILQHGLDRKTQGGMNYERNKKQIAKLHLKITRQREDFFDRLAYHWCKDYDVIVFENLQIANMVRNKHLSKSILDAGWGYFMERVQVKAQETGSKIVFIPPHYTSKTCSKCGYVFEDLRLSDRWIACPECGLSMDRDHNAAINILNRGLLDH